MFDFKEKVSDSCLSYTVNYYLYYYSTLQQVRMYSIQLIT